MTVRMLEREWIKRYVGAWAGVKKTKQASEERASWNSEGEDNK